MAIFRKYIFLLQITILLLIHAVMFYYIWGMKLADFLIFFIGCLLTILVLDIVCFLFRYLKIYLFDVFQRGLVKKWFKENHYNRQEQKLFENIYLNRCQNFSGRYRYEIENLERLVENNFSSKFLLELFNVEYDKKELIFNKLIKFAFSNNLLICMKNLSILDVNFRDALILLSFLYGVKLFSFFVDFLKLKRNVDNTLKSGILERRYC